MTTHEIKTIPQRWAAAWAGNDSEPWLALYADSAVYIDHSFGIRRAGRHILRKHHQIWLSSQPDFTLEIDPKSPIWWRDVDEAKGNGTASFRTINKGTFNGADLPSKKASGNQFEFSGVIDMVIEGGLIVSVNEWYTFNYDQSKPVEEYHTIDER